MDIIFEQLSSEERLLQIKNIKDEIIGSNKQKRYFYDRGIIFKLVNLLQQELDSEVTY